MKSISFLALIAFFVLPFSVRADDDGWIKMFDGETLKGWKANELADQWKVIDGAIVANSARSHLFYVGDDPKNPPEFKNFHWKADVQTKPKSNSGVFFHTHFQNDGWPGTGIEAQVNQTQHDPVKTGSLYNIKKNLEAPAKDDEWWNYEIIVNGKHVETKVNGKTIIEYDEPADIKKEPKLGGGTFALQAHDPGSTAMYKNIMVKRLP